MAYKIIKTLNRNERENVQLNVVGKQTWIEHYKQLWYKEEEQEELWLYTYTEVDSLAVEKLLEALRKTGKHRA